MKKHVSAILVLILVLPLISCKSNAQLSNTNTVVFSKGNCFRNCPVYSIEFNTKGEAQFEGSENVSQTGTRTFQIRKEELDQIKDILENLDFSALQKSYNTNIRDLPSTTIVYGDETVTYKGFKDVPQELKALSTLLENILIDNNFIN